MKIHFLLLALVAFVALSQHNVDARLHDPAIRRMTERNLLDELLQRRLSDYDRVCKSYCKIWRKKRVRLRCQKKCIREKEEKAELENGEACPIGVGMNQICKMLCSPIEKSTTICESGKTLARVGSCCGVQCVPKHCLGGNWRPQRPQRPQRPNYLKPGTRCMRKGPPRRSPDKEYRVGFEEYLGPSCTRCEHGIGWIPMKTTTLHRCGLLQRQRSSLVQPPLH